jgi:hypothetical protein
LIGGGEAQGGSVVEDEVRRIESGTVGDEEVIVEFQCGYRGYRDATIQDENDIEEKMCTLLTFLEFLVLVSLLTILDFLTVATERPDI